MIRTHLGLAVGAMLGLGACYGSVEPPGPLYVADGPEHSVSARSSTPASDDDEAPVPDANTFDHGLADSLTSTGSPDGAAGCGKIDFLFVVDNSLSMEREQENLSTSFPGFMQVIDENVRAKDFHVMVVDTDALSAADGDPARATRESVADAACGAQLGAGKRLDATGQDCGIRGGTRYMAPDQPDLFGTFACLGQVGTNGNAYERPMEALLEATSPDFVRPGGCNSQFLRSDAVLVVTIVTDEDDSRSPGTPESWRQALLEVKGGDPKAIVVLALVGDDNVPGGLPGGPCSSGEAEGSPILQGFAESFAFGSLGAICAYDYAPFFGAAVNVIGQACNGFVAPEIR